MAQESAVLEPHPKRLEHPDATCPLPKDKDMKELVLACWEQMWWCERAGNKHIKCYPPDGSRMVPIPSTPSSPRTRINKIAALKRGGLKI